MLQRPESGFAANRTVKLLAGTLLVLLLALVAVLVACSAPQTVTPIPNQQQTSVQQSASPFKVLSLAISPPNASQGQSVTISADIGNYSSDSGSYQAELRINDVVEATRVLTIPVGTIQRINFIVSKDQPGNYNVLFGDLNGKFAVAERASAVPISSPSANGQINPAIVSCCDPNQAKSSTGSGGCCGTPSQSPRSTSQPTSPGINQWGRSSGGGCCGR